MLIFGAKNIKFVDRPKLAIARASVEIASPISRQSSSEKAAPRALAAGNAEGQPVPRLTLPFARQPLATPCSASPVVNGGSPSRGRPAEKPGER
jgi:hypothetical protein